MVNVPQAVWIDEAGRIVRPPETAGSTDHFRRMDRVTRSMSPEDQAARLAARTAYLDAVEDWVLTGRYELPDDEVRRRLPRSRRRSRRQTRSSVWASGCTGTAAPRKLLRISPKRVGCIRISWTIWRQAADLQAVGAASGEAFWQRVDALGERPYYPPADFSG